jgi:hypothetical protein
MGPGLPSLHQEEGHDTCPQIPEVLLLGKPKGPTFSTLPKMYRPDPLGQQPFISHLSPGLLIWEHSFLKEMHVKVSSPRPPPHPGTGD